MKKGEELRGDWVRLDNAAKIYPPVISDELTAVFRISCILKSPVKIGSLIKAAEITSARFPYYNTILKRGFFWYYLEYSNNNPTVTGEEEYPLTAFPTGSRTKSLYRILARGKRISVEFLHVLTDGGGALEYLKTLLVTYFRICGHKIEYGDGIIDPDSPILEEELEDSFKRYYNKNIPKPKQLDRAWNFPFNVTGTKTIKITEAELTVSELKELARSENVSITEYLSAAYIFSMQEVFFDYYKIGYLPKHRKIRLEIPINMRALLPSKTMKNFSLFVMPEIDLRLGRYTFEEIIRIVYHFMQTETDKKLIYRIITQNVKPESNLFIRIMPLFIKDIVLNFAYNTFGPTKFTSVLSNMGVVRMPGECEDLIESFSIIPPPPNKKTRVSCGVVSYGTKMRITFANISESVELERRFFSLLASRGINIKLINKKSRDGR